MTHATLMFLFIYSLRISYMYSMYFGHIHPHHCPPPISSRTYSPPYTPCNLISSFFLLRLASSVCIHYISMTKIYHKTSPSTKRPRGAARLCSQKNIQKYLLSGICHSLRTQHMTNIEGFQIYPLMPSEFLKAKIICMHVHDRLAYCACMCGQMLTLDVLQVLNILLQTELASPAPELQMYVASINFLML